MVISQFNHICWKLFQKFSFKVAQTFVTCWAILKTSLLSKNRSGLIFGTSFGKLWLLFIPAFSHTDCKHHFYWFFYSDISGLLRHRGSAHLHEVSLMSNDRAKLKRFMLKNCLTKPNIKCLSNQCTYTPSNFS